MKKKTTILTIGDWPDYDSYKKLNKERKFILDRGFDYKTVRYKTLLKKSVPSISTERVIVFVFFPFVYWNKYIEHRHYRGVYGNKTFYKKFNGVLRKVTLILKEALKDKEVLFINDPLLAALYRDKRLVLASIENDGVHVPKFFNIKSVKSIRRLLEQGHKFFIKPKFGSMGKGITFLQLGDWETNFDFKDGKIISRKSDHGWKFRDITDNNAFLRKLLQKDVFMEEEIEPLSIKGDRVDFRVYTFFGKVLYVYPRRNKIGAVTTNISQGGHGDAALLKVIPKNVISRIEKAAYKATRTLGLKFTGIDVIVDTTLKKTCIVDVNMFPGFPKRRTFNLARKVVTELRSLDRKGKLKYTKGKDIRV